jgi:hypothetical protein
MIVTPGPLTVVNAYPDLTLPQADDGNALVLAHRARARGLDVETRTVHCGEELPAADIYVTGGLEDEDQVELARWLDAGGELRRAIAAGAGVLAVTSGLQVLASASRCPMDRCTMGSASSTCAPSARGRSSRAPWSRTPTTTSGCRRSAATRATSA